jgi:ORF6N domain
MQLQTIQSRIYEVRGQKVMLDYDLAELYEVPTKSLNQAIKRNAKRFPIDFMFRLTESEWETMRSQIVTASQSKRNVSATPYAFTEQGLAMLSGVLNSDKAIEVNISIMRAFVFIRQYALSHKDLSDKLKELETKYNKQFKDIGEALNYLLQKDKQVEVFKKRKQIGFKSGDQ